MLLNPVRVAHRQQVLGREMDCVLTKYGLSLAGAHVIDAGCSDGNWWDWYREQGVAQITAIDHRDLLTAPIPPDVTYLQADLEWDYPQVEADFFFGLGILYHLLNPAQFIQWASACAPYVILETTVWDETDEAILRMVQENRRENTKGSKDWAFWPSDLAVFNMIRATGMDVLRDGSMQMEEPRKWYFSKRM